MPKIIEIKTIWKCDRCKKEVQSETKPNEAHDPWGTLFIDQDAGFDHHGAPWAPRMREKLLLCGECIDAICKTVNQISQPLNVVFDGPPDHVSGRFVECETDDGKSVSAGEWIKRDDDLWSLRIICLPVKK